MSPDSKPSAVRSSGWLHDAAGAITPTGLVLLGIVSAQLGAAIAKGLFDELGPAGTVFLLADDREGLVDSRSYGPVPNSALAGRIIATVWPPARIAVR